MELNTSTTAFLACHFENDVVGAEGAFAPFFRAEIERRGVLGVAKRLLDEARAAGVQIVYTRVAFQEGHSDLVTNIPLLGVVAQQGSLLDNTPATEIVDELKPEIDDWIVTNPKVSAFASSDLDERLRAAGIDTVVVFGVATNLSVESTGRAAGDLGYRVVVVDNACSAAAPEAHDATIASFGLLGEVASADDVIAAL
ncbi:isochorismatase family cysteine hydrolase [Nocardioides limicola]|uniref:isochorismatase family cysteine hydrolase n=1 Tax=Nocardioides limicola TaxID=2803368 RepID=UPI00193AFF90|nr:isochorismatase family cysteine hydrolase [Nocardioides sp. DJM-14]